jgi:hypothetical protein
MWVLAQRKARHFVQLGGPALLLLAGLGVWHQVLNPHRRNRPDTRRVALAWLLACIWIFESVVASAREYRHVLAAAPPLVLFAGSGVAWVAQRVRAGGTSPAVRVAALCIPLGLAIVGTDLLDGRPSRTRIPRREHAAAAEDLVARSSLNDSVFMISSDASGEGAFIAAVATHERRPGHVVLRASKMLARDDWMGRTYEPIFTKADEIAAFLERVPVGVVVLNHGMRPKSRHHILLEEIVLTRSDRWIPVSPSQASSVRAYRLANHEGRPVMPFDIPVPRAADIR